MRTFVATAVFAVAFAGAPPAEAGLLGGGVEVLDDGREVRAGEVLLVPPRPLAGLFDLLGLVNGLGLGLVEWSPELGAARVRLPLGETVTAALARLNGRNDRTRAYPNAVAFGSALAWRADGALDPTAGGADPDGAALIDLADAWRLRPNANGAWLAVLDTGVAYESYGFTYARLPVYPNIAFGAAYDFVDGDSHANDPHQHGTHITSIATAVAGRRVGVMPVRVLDASAVGDEYSVAKGLMHAAASGADVVNLSLTFGPHYQPSEVMIRAVQSAIDADAVLVAAAGNDGAPAVGYPAALPEFLAVGAVDRAGAVAAYSNRGAALDLVAPGGGEAESTAGVRAATFAPNRPRSFDAHRLSGTSAAAAWVSGVAALARAHAPGVPAADVAAVIAATARDRGAAGFDEESGAGLLAARAALEGVQALRDDPGGALAARIKPVPTIVTPAVFLESVPTAVGTGVRAVALLELVDEVEAPVAGARLRVSWLGSAVGGGGCTTDASGRCLAVSPLFGPVKAGDGLLYALRVDRALLADGRQSRPAPGYQVDAGGAAALQASIDPGAPPYLVAARYTGAAPGAGSYLAGRRLLPSYMTRALAHERVGSCMVFAFNEALRAQMDAKSGLHVVDGGIGLDSLGGGEPLFWVSDHAAGTGLMASGRVIGHRTAEQFGARNAARFGNRWSAFGSGLMASGYSPWFLFSLSFKFGPR